MGVRAFVRPRLQAAVGPAVPRRVAVRLDHLHGLLHDRAPLARSAHRRVQGRTARDHGGPDDGRDVGVHLCQRRVPAVGADLAGQVEPPQGRVLVLLPNGHPVVGQGPDPEPLDVLHLRPRGALWRGALAALDARQRSPHAQRRKDVQVDRQLAHPPRIAPQVWCRRDPRHPRNPP